jgi:hypothetical protein
LTVFCLPARHRVRMRTSNMLERLNRETDLQHLEILTLLSKATCAHEIRAWHQEKSVGGGVSHHGWEAWIC